MTETEELRYYVVYFEDMGYYADKQTNENKINFTHNFLYAKRYKTTKGAYKLIKQAVEIEKYQNIKTYVQPLEVKTTIDYTLEEMKHVIFKPEIKHVIQFIELPLKVNVVRIEDTDDFWLKTN